jgi:hypothetical protein
VAKSPTSGAEEESPEDAAFGISAALTFLAAEAERFGLDGLAAVIRVAASQASQRSRRRGQR